MLVFALCVLGCNITGDQAKYTLYKGVYTAREEIKSFKDCDSGHEYWAADRSGKLESSYNKLNPEKTDMPVYVEVEGEKVKSGKVGKGYEFDSTLVVRKIIKITRDIPQDMCN